MSAATLNAWPHKAVTRTMRVMWLIDRNDSDDRNKLRAQESHHNPRHRVGNAAAVRHLDDCSMRFLNATASFSVMPRSTATYFVGRTVMNDAHVRVEHRKFDAVAALQRNVERAGGIRFDRFHFAAHFEEPVRVRFVANRERHARIVREIAELLSRACVCELHTAAVPAEPHHAALR